MYRFFVYQKNSCFAPGSARKACRKFCYLLQGETRNLVCTMLDPWSWNCRFFGTGDEFKRVFLRMVIFSRQKMWNLVNEVLFYTV